MKSRLTILMTMVSLISWSAMGGINPDIVEVDLDIEGVDDTPSASGVEAEVSPGGFVEVDSSVTIILKVTSSEWVGTGRLTWDNASKITVMEPEGEEIENGHEFGSFELDSGVELYVEGKEVSGGLADVKMMLEALHCAPGMRDIVAFTVVKVELPQGTDPGIDNTALWMSTGLTSALFQIRPDFLEASVPIYWSLSGLPDGHETKIRWDIWDFINGRLDVGYGLSPDLTVTYFDILSDYDDEMPPDNSWFGPKVVDVAISDSDVVARNMWFYFYVQAVRPKFSGDKVAAWYYYWRQGAVSALTSFAYVHDLSALAEHSWSLLGGDKFSIGYAAESGIEKPVFDVTARTYTEQDYPDHKGVGIHGVAKICAHENWHAVLLREVRSSFWGGGGETDTDGDGLSDTREDEIGTRPDIKDTCNISSYTGGGADYSDHAGYADQELFCRWKQEGVLGDENKDWAFPGMQAHVKP